MIEMCLRILREVGVEGARVHLNSLGGVGTREAFREALVRYFEPHRAQLSEDSRRRLDKNPLRILDSKAPEDRALCEGAPSILDVLGDEDRAHFDGVRAGLDALGVDYVVDPKLVRGLDYYTRTLFEIQATTADLGAQSTVCGGGRYDGMVEGLGGPKVPAIGFAMGLERLLIAASAKQAPVDERPVYVAVLDASAAPRALAFASALRELGVKTELDARDVRLKGMLKRANAMDARYCVLVGASELSRGEVTLKDLAAHTQEALGLATAPALVAARAKIGGVAGPGEGGA
jgi:histidyl-tRNA synthetase